MEILPDLKPALSVVLPAMMGYDAIEPALSTWVAQIHRSELEILVLCPAGLGPSGQQSLALPPEVVPICVGTAGLHEARAIGIQKARGDYIMLAEDHCLPNPE
jgi:hypothetical protein